MPKAASTCADLVLLGKEGAADRGGEVAVDRRSRTIRAGCRWRRRPSGASCAGPGQRLDRLRQRLQELGEQHRARLDLQWIAGAAAGGAVGLQGAVRRRHGFVLAGSRQQPRRDVDGLHQHLDAGPDQQRLPADRQVARLCRIEDGGRAHLRFVHAQQCSGRRRQVLRGGLRRRLLGRHRPFGEPEGHQHAQPQRDVELERQLRLQRDPQPRRRLLQRARHRAPARRPDRTASTTPTPRSSSRTAMPTAIPTPT